MVSLAPSSQESLRAVVMKLSAAISAISTEMIISGAMFESSVNSIGCSNHASSNMFTTLPRSMEGGTARSTTRTSGRRTSLVRKMSFVFRKGTASD